MAPVREKVPRPSNLALKQTMAVTGLLFVGFVVIHLFGNLKVFAGEEAFNHYAAWLREVGYPLLPRESVLWGLRIVLLVSLIGHAGASCVLRLRARRARGPHRRRVRGYRPLAAGWMLLGGLLILAFILFHLSDLTLGGPGASTGFRHPDGQMYAYQNLVASFSRPWAALCYMAAMLVIAVHIEHGWRTLLQDLGMTGQRLRRAWAFLGGLLALAVVLGNASIPVLVLTGVIA
ncbi:succinate dehydrogenase cytochrome b subunit [Arachnia propionica]|uniref:Succinate dehydrogenase cytochrome b subunit n=2 Tax=Arachnia propionica TaxID=1750 RepID=A0A3P1T8K3_9ACTN|nr:succinate dehydrogenase cytochrome b subunit [Arachnia propionica]MDO5084636.1 succinate dehydrogenase cytochrome b subunit [Arachnia propionica]RRD05670.1 succinate dehydrogenase cytochrome b subunit [Arachnia propionica]